MRMGTKSLLFGAHQFILHPIFVARAWIKLYGWSWHPLLWFSFIVHDWGYWGRRHMDDEDGERHVLFGANVLKLLGGSRWGDFTVAHSRFWASNSGIPISRLCVADKLSLVVCPPWLYVLLTRWTGEILEYKGTSKHVREVGQHKIENASVEEDLVWLNTVRDRMRHFSNENRDSAARWDRRLKRGPYVECH
jgi:hypothetical protein